MEEIEEPEPGDPVTDRNWAAMQVDQWREYADVLEALPGLAAFRDYPETFESMLYDAAGVVGGTAAMLGEDTTWIEIYR